MPSPARPDPAKHAAANDDPAAAARRQACTPAQACAAISRAGRDVQTLIIDFDETLWLRNSTEAYLAQLRPSYAGGLLLYLLDQICKLLRRSGQPTLAAPGLHDWLRVAVCTLLMPWTAWRWRREARSLATQYANQRLLDAIEDARAQAPAGQPPPRVIVCSLGFRRLIKPLLAGMRRDQWTLVAAGGPGDRLRGKLSMLAAQAPDVDLSTALVLTDSRQDQQLLNASAVPILTRWPDARYARALDDAYLPLWYTAKIKRPGQRYLWRGILQDDFAFWLLALAWGPLIASAGLVEAVVRTLTGSGLLLLSFWCIYELGYRDNDAAGHRLEAQPRLHPEFGRGTMRRGTVAAWCWAIGAAALGVLALDPLPGTATWPTQLLLWIAFLLGVLGVFAVFNRLPKPARVWLFPVLQGCRTFALCVVLIPSLPGVLLLAAHMLSRSLPYWIYRTQGTQGLAKYPKYGLATLRIGVFGVLLGAVAISGSEVRAALEPLTIAVLLAWCALRARRELPALARSFREPLGGPPN